MTLVTNSAARRRKGDTDDYVSWNESHSLIKRVCLVQCAKFCGMRLKVVPWKPLQLCFIAFRRERSNFGNVADASVRAARSLPRSSNSLPIDGPIRREFALVFTFRDFLINSLHPFSTIDLCTALKAERAKTTRNILINGVYVRQNEHTEFSIASHNLVETPARSFYLLMITCMILRWFVSSPCSPLLSVGGESDFRDALREYRKDISHISREMLTSTFIFPRRFKNRAGKKW